MIIKNWYQIGLATSFKNLLNLFQLTLLSSKARMRTSISVMYIFPPPTIIITKLLNAILKCISKKVLYHTSRVKTLKCLACSHFAGNRMQAAEVAAETPGGLTSARKLLSHFAPKPSSTFIVTWSFFFPRQIAHHHLPRTKKSSPARGTLLASSVPC